MRTLKMILSLLLMSLTLMACSAPKVSDKWDASEMAGITDPGFSVVSKSKTNNETKLLFKNVEVTAANNFLTLLYATEFTENVYYNYTESFYTYSTSNSVGKSINFEYNVSQKTASFTYALSGGSTPISSVMDMGYYLKVNFEEEMDADYKNYMIWQYYNINPEVHITNPSETVVSCVLKNIKIKSASRLGSLSISNDPFKEETLVEVNCLNQGFINPTFIVRQKGIGKVSSDFASSQNKKDYFDKMSVSQSDLNFVISFTAEVQTNNGIYTKAYEIPVLPSGFDATSDNVVDKVVSDLSKGTPFTKQ